MSRFCYYRMMTAELVGAEIIVLDSKGFQNTVGIKGVVIEQSANCLFVVASKRTSCEQVVTVGSKRKYDQMISSSDVNEPYGDNDKKSIDRKMIRVVLNAAVIGVLLPVDVHRVTTDLGDTQTNEISQNICVIYGSKFLKKKPLS